jgi:hypothetical protein
VLLNEKGGLGDGVCELENGGEYKLAGKCCYRFLELRSDGDYFHMAKKHGAQVEAYKLQNIRY